MYTESSMAAVLDRVLLENPSNSINSSGGLTAPLTTRGIRARLGFWRPYNAFFRASVIIHQICYVPFATGEFGVRWRFKDVQNPKEGLFLGSNLGPPRTPSRGDTPFIKLSNNAVIWSYTLEVPLRIGVDRETAQMSPSPLKLVVLQRMSDGDPSKSPQTTRIGAVYLDLAQFVGKGNVQRWYLLRESKTNIIIKLTLEMEHVSGESRFVPPPLGQPEIKGIVTDTVPKDPPDPARYREAQRELHEYVAAQMAEVLAEHQVESPQIKALSHPIAGLQDPDDLPLEESHLKTYEQQFHSEAYEQTLRPFIAFNPDNTASPRSRTSSNSSYASARSTMSIAESIYRDDISLYSIASSRTADTDYGTYYRRMALSQSTMDSERTTEIRRSRSWTPSTVHRHD